MPRGVDVITVRTEVLRASITRRNMTADEFARRVKTSPPSISRILSGKRVPGPDLRKRIMDELGMGFDDLFDITPAAELARR
jgi:transcriptional regulator with XRE-family HTH domain